MFLDGDPARVRGTLAKPSPVGWGLLVAACCVALLALGPVYDTNDDPAIVELLAAGLGAPFLGKPLNLALLWLYAAAPGVPWYGLLIEGCAIVSAGLWAGLLASCRPAPALRRGATAGLLVGCSYLVLRVNFMAAAFSLFLAATAWLWKKQIDGSRVRWSEAWIGLALGAAHLVRPSLQWLMLFFALPVLAVSVTGRNLRRLLVIAVPAGALILASALGEPRRSADPEAKALAGLDRARSLLVDVPRDPGPRALAAAGWSPGDYEVAVRFGVYDEQLYSVARIRAFVAETGWGLRPDRLLQTSRTYLLGRFHLVCVAALSCVLWLRWSAGGALARPLPVATRALTWGWLLAGTLALAVVRFPPRAFVPLYAYLGALALLLPPRTPAPRAAGPARRAASAAALGALAVALGSVLAYWHLDARSGMARLAADRREFDTAARALAADAILVPVGQLMETQYGGALSPPPAGARPEMPPAGWVAATPALGRFLKRNGFADGRTFMAALVQDPRVVFVVRRSLSGDVSWLLERLEQRYAPGAGLSIEPLGPPADGPRLLYFRVRRAAPAG